MTASKRDPLEEALKLLEHASDARSRLRALEAVRASLSLELRDHARARTALKSPTEEQLAQLRKNLASAWLEYESVKDGGLETALRALQGVREAIGQLRAATARQAEDPVTLVFYGAGREITRFTVSRPEFCAFHRIPERYRSADYRVEVQMVFEGEPHVSVFRARGSKLVWERGSKPTAEPPQDVPPQDVQLDEDPDFRPELNGHGLPPGASEEVSQ